MSASIGKEMYLLAEKIFPICRSITGNGVRQTLDIFKDHIPGLKVVEIPTGTKCFDWTIPKEWNIKDAYVKNSKGERIIDFQKSNLHVVSYSIPVEQKLKLSELKKHLYSLPHMPEAIPYITSYYQERWGFCLTHKQLDSLPDDIYDVKIDSTLADGSLTYAELIIPGKTDKEIFFSTYVCHPSMGNNEVSGPVLATFLAKYVSGLDRKYTYRFVFIPETIGAIAYLSGNVEAMKKNTIAGFNLTCVGDDRAYSYLPSRHGNTFTDKVIKHVLKHKVPSFRSYSFLERGSDERQYCSPGVDLPVASLMRTRYGDFKEYHTSLDDLNLISENGFQGSFNVHKECIDLLEVNVRYTAVIMCEPQLGKRGLRSNIGGATLASNFKLISDVLAYADGESDLVELAEKINAYALDLVPVIKILLEHNLLRRIDNE